MSKVCIEFDVVGSVSEIRGSYERVSIVDVEMHLSFSSPALSGLLH